MLITKWLMLDSFSRCLQNSLTLTLTQELFIRHRKEFSCFYSPFKNIFTGYKTLYYLLVISFSGTILTEEQEIIPFLIHSLQYHSYTKVHGEGNYLIMIKFIKTTKMFFNATSRPYNDSNELCRNITVRIARSTVLHKLYKNISASNAIKTCIAEWG